MKKKGSFVIFLFLLCALAFTVSEIEPNDDWWETNVLLVGNGAHTGNLIAYDADYWKFETLVGDTIEIHTCVGTSGDTELFLYQPNGYDLIDSNNDYCGLQSRVSMITPSSGTYYFAVRNHYLSVASGNYTVTLSGANIPSPDHPDAATCVLPSDADINVVLDGMLI
ncbi:MAG: PPC domain-containing protein [Candidatus Cloacimonetes bacterium]|nr:PPC domain-containing protein [Candidatus Cloacimonadota bacterium]